MRVLLTGSSGFIGTYFLKHYSCKYTIQPFSFLNDNFTTLQVKDVDVVVHLSALVHQMGGASAEAYEDINVTQTLALARKSKESGVRHFIFMSTVKVYGEESDEVYTENFICNPQDDYGKSKLRAEVELQKLVSKDFVVSIIRTPIVYGYGVKANIKSLINLINKVSILPFANIQNKRSFVFVGNLCAMVDKIIETQKGGIFLACDDTPLSTTQLIELIASAMDKKVHLVAVPFFARFFKWLKPSMHQRLYGSLEVDNALTKKILGFENPYTVEEGIKRMIHGEKI